MRRLDVALERHEAVQRSRTVAWATFGILAPLSLLFWLEVIFALGHLSDVSILQLVAELLLAIISTLAAIHRYRAGMRFNQLLGDTSQLLDDDAG